MSFLNQPHVLFLPSWYPRDRNDLNGCFFREQAIALKISGAKVGVLAHYPVSLKFAHRILFKSSIIKFENDNEVHTYRKRIWYLVPKSVLFKELFWIFVGNRQFKAYIKKEGIPDVIHVHSLVYAGALAFYLKNRFKIPVVVSEHSSSFLKKTYPSQALHMSIKKWCQKADRLFAVSSSLASSMNNKITGISRTWNVMPNSIDERLFSDSLSGERSLGSTKFIHVSLLTHNKRVDLILRAFAMCQVKNPNVELIIGGPIEQTYHLKKLAVDLGVETRVKFTGVLSREGVQKAIASADIFLLASDQETFGVVVIEALALGKPVVSTRCGGPEDILHTENGILVDRGSTWQYAKAMLRAAAKTYDAEAISTDCKRRFGTSALTSKWKEIYKSLFNPSMI